MCVVIIDSKTRNLYIETGIDLTAVKIGNEEDKDFFFKNSKGIDKRFPGGPTCMYKGKEIPCMVRFSEGGGITTKILTDILRTLDSLELFSAGRENGIRPFVLLDGHGSRFGLEFLKYINEDSHRWSVCIGVPYGTAYWQIGDSTEQNGSFKLHLSKRKEMMVRLRQDFCGKSMQLVPTDIIPLINYAW